MIQREQIEEEVRAVLSDKLKISPEKIRPEVRLIQDLGVDSLDLLLVARDVEEKYDLHIPDTLLQSSPTFGEIVDLVCDIVNKKGTELRADARAS
jgi:acyl carrier protein